MKQLTGDEIKETIFNILCAFADYCDAHSLSYFLCGGTLIGAIRHKDFIPWDDDIDVLMPRKDFDRLHELVKTEPVSDRYKLVGLNAGNGVIPFSKVIDTKTSIDIKYADSDRQLWIDIFPMDGVPEDEEESRRYLEKAARIKKSLTRSRAKIGEGKSAAKAVGKIPMIIVLKAIGPAYFGKKLDEMARKYDFESSRFIAGVSWSLGPGERVEKAKYLPAEDVEFHGRLFHAPAGWDHFLTSVYGDYMTLPPEEKRVSHEYIAYLED